MTDSRVTDFRVERVVAFSETDAAQIVHFSNFFRWMEDCEHAFVRSLGTSVHLVDEDGFRGFPRVSASCEYLRPVHFEDVVAVELTVKERRTRSIRYGFTFRCRGEVVARGETVVVCARSVGGKLSAVALPVEFGG